MMNQYLFAFIISFLIGFIANIIYGLILFKKENNFDFDNIEISSKNKILFYKLKKKYLNNCSDNDIKELISFLIDVLDERGYKNE